MNNLNAGSTHVGSKKKPALSCSFRNLVESRGRQSFYNVEPKNAARETINAVSRVINLIAKLRIRSKDPFKSCTLTD